MARTISLMCNLGDLTFGWDSSDDATILPMIQALIDQKVRFFIVRKRGKLSEVTKLSQAVDARKLNIPSESWQQLFGTGLLRVAGELGRRQTTGEIATTAQEVLENDTVAVNPVAGG